MAPGASHGPQGAETRPKTRGRIYPFILPKICPGAILPKVCPGAILTTARCLLVAPDRPDHFFRGVWGAATPQRGLRHGSPRDKARVLNSVLIRF